MNIIRTILICLVFSSLALAGEVSSARKVQYCVAILPCPVLNSPNFQSTFGGKDHQRVKTDKKGLIRAMEFIALPGTPFEIMSEMTRSDHSIFEVKTPDYPSEKSLFIDSRFVTFAEQNPPKRAKPLFPANKILSSLRSMKTQPYMWGGNYCAGIKQMTEFYPPSGIVSPKTLSLWHLEGVDCSGLIYQASGGYTPRNTSSMLTFGKGLRISGLSATEISRKIKPLDLIVWPGHVIIVFDPGSTIESSNPKGVFTSNLVTRLNSIMLKRTPRDNWDGSFKKSFVIRRWHDTP